MVVVVEGNVLHRVQREGELSGRGNVREGICPRGKCLEGNVLHSLCVCTVHARYRHTDRWKSDLTKWSIYDVNLAKNQASVMFCELQVVTQQAVCPWHSLGLAAGTNLKNSVGAEVLQVIDYNDTVPVCLADVQTPS